MQNPPTAGSRGAGQLGGDGDPSTRKPEKSNVIRFPNERRIARIEVNWTAGFDNCIAEMVERSGERTIVASDRNLADLLRITRKFAAELRLPIIDKTNPPQVRVERPNREDGSAV